MMIMIRTHMRERKKERGGFYKKLAIFITNLYIHIIQVVDPLFRLILIEPSSIKFSPQISYTEEKHNFSRLYSTRFSFPSYSLLRANYSASFHSLSWVLYTIRFSMT